MVWAAAIGSGWAPADRLTWCLEAAPALVIYTVLIACRGRFRLTPLAAWLCLVLMLIIFLGGHFGFAAVPGFEGPRSIPGGVGHRNEFDKFAHFFQGLVPAIVFRELLIRLRAIALPSLLPIAVLAFTLSLSALYELCEWASHLVLGWRADAFIASQADTWDAQSDMAMALLGALTALAALSRRHDVALAALARDAAAKISFDNAAFRG